MRALKIGLALLALMAVAQAAPKKQAEKAEQECTEAVWIYLPAPEGDTEYRAVNNGKAIQIYVDSTVFNPSDKLWRTYRSEATFALRPGVTAMNTQEGEVVFTENGSASPAVKGQTQAAGQVLVHYLDLRSLRVVTLPHKDPAYRMVSVDLPASWTTGITGSDPLHIPQREWGNYGGGYGGSYREQPSYPWKVSNHLVMTIDQAKTAASVARCATKVVFDEIDVDSLPATPVPAAKR